MVARARMPEVSKMRPSGIILIRAATVLVTAIAGSVSVRKRAQRSRAPIGIRVQLMYLTILFIRVKSLLSAVLMA